MEHHNRQQRRTRSSWWWTLVAQVFLCIALYAALNIGRPQAGRRDDVSNGGHFSSPRSSSHRPTRPLDLYFISVRGGPRPLEQQNQLLGQMDKVAGMYRAKFVLDLSEFGEEDPLMHNATLHFSSLKVPWYTTRVSWQREMGYFLMQISLPHWQTLDIIGLDTGLWQDCLHMEQLSDRISDQLHWLTKTLAASESNWRIVVGFHPLVACEEERATEKMNFYDNMHHIFLMYGVNAYISKQGCTGHYGNGCGIAFIVNPGHTNGYVGESSVNGSSNIDRDMLDGFLLHRVSPLEMDSYYINSAGDIVSKSTVHQKGREVM